MNVHNQHSGCICSIIGWASWEIVTYINSMYHINSKKEILAPCPSFGGSMKKSQDSQEYLKVFSFYQESTDVPMKTQMSSIISPRDPCVRTTAMTRMFVLRIEPRTLRHAPYH